MAKQCNRGRDLSDEPKVTPMFQPQKRGWLQGHGQRNPPARHNKANETPKSDPACHQRALLSCTHLFGCCRNQAGEMSAEFSSRQLWSRETVYDDSETSNETDDHLGP